MTTDAIEAIEPVDDARSIGPVDRFGRRCAGAVAAAIREEAERVKRRELKEAIGRLEARGDLGDTEREAVEEMADSIVEEFLAGPTESLRQSADWSAIHTALRLFDPEFETDDGSAHPDEPVTSEGNDD